MSVPTVPDDLDRPVTQRQFLEVLADMASNGDVFAEWAWERFTARWRQDARAHALTQVDRGHEHPTREG